MRECMYCGKEVKWADAAIMTIKWNSDATTTEERRYCESCAKGLLKYADWRLGNDKPKEEEKE